MDVINTNFPDVKLIDPNVHGDHRGFFMESYNKSVFEQVGINYNFVQDNQSYSKDAGTIRGLHYQLNAMAQTKLVRVLRGAVYDVVVDIRRNSPTFGHWEGYILSEYNLRQLLVPKGFAHGFCTLIPDTQIYYKVDEYYSPEHDKGIFWNDSDLDITWPVSHPTLSNKDKDLPLLKHAELNF